MQEKDIEKQIMRAERTNILVLIVLAILVVVAFVFILSYKYQHTFTVEKWNDDIDDRRKIVSDMLQKHQLVGMDTSDIIYLLGEEDSTRSSFKMSRETFPPETTLVYHLGVDFMDNWWLIISLENGVASRYCIDAT